MKLKNNKLEIVLSLLIILESVLDLYYILGIKKRDKQRA